jgi:hypothetical protein
MPDGHLQDPRLNSTEKEYGTLTASEIGRDGKNKTFIYLKDEVSRFYTAGSPVKFDIEERKVYYSNSDMDNFVTIEVATNVRIDDDRIKDHPIISKLNEYTKTILPPRGQAKAV